MGGGGIVEQASARARSLFVPSDNDDGDAPHALVVAHLPRREEVRSRTIIDPRAFAFLSRPRPKKDPPTRWVKKEDNPRAEFPRLYYYEDDDRMTTTTTKKTTTIL